jgi:hypothetical protein
MYIFGSQSDYVVEDGRESDDLAASVFGGAMPQQQV